MSKLLWLSTILVAVVSGCGVWLLIGSKSVPPKGTYEQATKISTPAEIATVIQENVELSSSFTAARVARQLVAIELASGGTTFTIYRFNFPQTCGQAGCLHVAVDRQDRRSIPLQLVDLPEREARHQGGRPFVFKSIAKAGCLAVEQPVNGVSGAIEDYEICKPK
jgi:hypothetical protein